MGVGVEGTVMLVTVGRWQEQFPYQQAEQLSG